MTLHLRIYAKTPLREITAEEGNSGEQRCLFSQLELRETHSSRYLQCPISLAHGTKPTDTDVIIIKNM